MLITFTFIRIDTKDFFITILSICSLQVLKYRMNNTYVYNRLEFIRINFLRSLETRKMFLLNFIALENLIESISCISQQY